MKRPLTWFLGALLLTLAVGFAFADPPDNRPPDNRPPDHDQPGNPTQNTQASSETSSTADAVSGADALSKSSAVAGGATGGDGGSGYGEGGRSEGGDGGSSDGNQFRGGDNESTYLNLGMAMVNIDGCIVAKHVGGGDGNGGAIIQWGSVNHTCIMNEMANAEKHVKTRAMLKCAAKEYRNAIAYDQPGGVWPFNRKQTKARQEYCIDHTITITMGEIDYLAELLAPEPTTDPEEPELPK